MKYPSRFRNTHIQLLFQLIICSAITFAQSDIRMKPQPLKPKIGQTASRKISVSEFKTGVAPDGRGKLWAVVIGVSNYPNLKPEDQLKFAHRDAEAMGEFLRSPEGGGFPSSQIKLLLNQNATVAAIRTALGSWLARSAQADDIVYIFFAGHGVVENNEAYLLAHDSDPQNLYATALSVGELNRIVSERVKSRVQVIIADACHSGKLGLTSRGTSAEALINRYFDESGKSGAGSFKLLASRDSESSYEDTRWGGGHGVFTYHLLESLRGKADSDNDGVVRAGEVVNYLSEIVPNETKALQHPRVAGNLDARLPLAVLSSTQAPAADTAALPASLTLEVRGISGSEVYVNAAYKGRIRPSGVLLIDGLQNGDVELSVDPPGGETLKQNLTLNAEKTVLDLSTAIPARAAMKSSPLVAQIKEAITQGKIVEADGAWALYQQLIRDTPDEPQRAAIEIDLKGALDEVGQQSVNNYVRTSAKTFNPEQLRRASLAFAALKQLDPASPQVEAKRLFAAARVLLVEGKPKEAIALLEKSIQIDAKTACPFNALGAAYEAANEADKAMDFFKRAVLLAPGWSLPHYRLGLQYYSRNKTESAARELKAAVQLDPAFLTGRWWLARMLRASDKLADAEREAIELIRIAPNYTPAYVELGLIYEADKQFGKAAKTFDAYLRSSMNAATVNPQAKAPKE
ncbi:MAG: caspase family protein [Acidobacteriota bacterium]